MIANPASFWECLSDDCTVTAFGLPDKLEGQGYTQCPKCKHMSKRTTKAIWQSARLAYEQILCRSPHDLWPAA